MAGYHPPLRRKTLTLCPGLVDHYTSLAPGDASGNGKGGGKGESESPEWLVEGVLQQMWQTCTGLAKLYPRRISAVGWYTTSLGLQCEGIPQYQFIHTKAEADQSAAINLKPTKASSSKALLVIRMTVDHRHIYIIEIYRKPSLSNSNENGSNALKEESYCGLMVNLPKDRNEAHLQLQLIFQNLLRYEGRIKDKAMSGFPHKAFVHRPRETGETPLKRVVISNLEKLIGFTLEG